MKTSIIGSGLLAATLALLFFVPGNAVSEDKPASQTPAKVHSSVSVEANHPLAIAHQQLEQARKDFSKGDIEAVRMSLEAANKLLQDPKMSRDSKTINEASELVKEIQQLQAKINNPSDEHEGTISRLWHRSSALAKREIEHITKSWKDVSTSNKTMKHLVDARLHFNYAEHELFISHKVEKADEELKNTLTYLDKAYEIANPQAREKLASLKKDIQRLSTSHVNTAEEQMIFQALEEANAAIDKVRQSVNPEIRARSKKISADIMDLKKNIIMLERRYQYDTIMNRLFQLDKLL